MTEEDDMSAVNTTKNTALKARGRAKEAAGAVVGNEDLKAEGRADQLLAAIRQSGNRLEDSFKSLKKAFKI